MDEPLLWTLEGYVTGTGNRPVEDWFYGLGLAERRILRQRINYLANIERNLWVLPFFGTAGAPIWEVRRDTPDGWIRLYGIFPSGRRHCFVFLHGHDKSKKNDISGKQIALQRFKLLNQKVGNTHVIGFQERPS